MATLFLAAVAVFLAAQALFPLFSWKFFACMVVAGIALGIMQKQETAFVSVISACFHAMIFAFASLASFVILLVLVAKGTFEWRDALMLGLACFAACFIGALVGIAAKAVRSVRKVGNG